MIRIAISIEAFDAICATLALGNVGYEADPNERGERLIWLEDAMADQLGAMRRPGESHSDVILRLVGIWPLQHAKRPDFRIERHA